MGKKTAAVKEKHNLHGNQNYSHPWLVANLKGHSGRVLDVDFSANGKYLASCSEDGTVLIWPTKLFQQSNKMPIRGNIAYDQADKVRWSPDSKAFVVHKSVGDEIEVYKLTKKDEGRVIQFYLPIETLKLITLVVVKPLPLIFHVRESS